MRLEQGQTVTRADGRTGVVGFGSARASDYLVRVEWDDGTRLHYRTNGRWCGAWGNTPCSLDIARSGSPAPVAAPSITDMLMSGGMLLASYVWGYGFGSALRWVFN